MMFIAIALNATPHPADNDAMAVIKQDISQCSTQTLRHIPTHATRLVIENAERINSFIILYSLTK
jgi:hypothetical protein